MKVSPPNFRAAAPATFQRTQAPALDSNPQDVAQIGQSTQEMGPDPITPLFRVVVGTAIGGAAGIGTGAYLGAQNGLAAGLGGAVAGAVVGGLVGYVAGAVYHKLNS